MKAIRWFVLSPFVVPLLAACGHGQNAAPPRAAAAPRPPVTAASPVTPAPAPSASQEQAPMDPARALLSAAEGLRLSPRQRATVNDLEDQLAANAEATRSAFRGLRVELASEVRTGAIDPQAMQAMEAMAAGALQTHVDKEVATINALHGALEPAQRAQIVASSRANRPGAAEAQPPSGMQQSPDAMRQMRLAGLTRELGLDANQQKQVGALLAESPAAQAPTTTMDHQRQLDALLGLFPSQTFDARSAVKALPVPPGEMLRQHIDDEVTFLSRLLPILRPDQRELLASNMQAHAMGTDTQ